MSIGPGLTLLAMALPAGGALDMVSVDYHGDNGSLPPPYRRSTEIRIDSQGNGTLTRLRGYDRQDPAQRFQQAFVVPPARQREFAQRLQQLGLWTTRWRERERVPVGGPLVHLSFRRADQSVTLPAFPVASQQDAVDALRAEVLALVPEDATAARQAWERE